jgi:SAM-dependent methyltransferase
MINLARLTPNQIRLAQSLTKGGNFAHPFIKNAPNEIARLHGRTNFDELILRYNLIRESPFPLQKIREQLIFQPYNYQRIPCEYVALEVMLNLLELGHKKNIMLQLASNYGPFLFYLKQMGFTDLYGVDIDAFAVKYANRIGNNVLLAQADRLPIADSTFDIVFSQNFIDFEYLKFAYAGLNNPNMTDIITSIMNEIYRVLKPGGVFISSQEIFTIKIDQKLWGPFSIRQSFSDEINEKYTALCGICVFEKA